MPIAKQNGLVSKFIFSHREPITSLTGQGTKKTRKELLADILADLQGGVGGALPFDSFWWLPNVAGAARAAAGTVAISGGAGAVGVILNGVTITAAFAASDQNSAGLMLAAINASVNARIQNVFAAGGATRATIAAASVLAGTALSVYGYGFTGIGATATPAALNEFSVGASDAACATNLASAINGMPFLNDYCLAFASAANVFVYPKYTQATVPAALAENVIWARAATFTVTQQTANPSFAVFALEPGLQGNFATWLPSGTGVTTPLTESVGAVNRLTGGVGGNSAGRQFSRF